MRINEANIFLFIATVLIGILISMNLNLDDKVKYLDVEQYKVAYNERLKLQSEIGNLQDKYDELNTKLNKYKRSSAHSYEVMDEMREEVKNNKFALGLVPVQGSGVTITLNDSPEVATGKYTSLMLIHDGDVMRVINDLRNAGAEAISINGYRIVYSSSQRCAGPVINQDGKKISAPFTITAIGNKEAIEAYLKTQENHVKTLELRRCFVDIEPVYDVKLPAYTGSLPIEFSKPK